MKRSTKNDKSPTKKPAPAANGTKKKTMEQPAEFAPRARAKRAKGAAIAQGEPQAASAIPAASAGAEGATKAARAASAGKTEPRPRDPRFPEPGTVLEKRDRHGNVRCRCTVEAEGIRYAGTLYTSISSAALAAAKDLGLKNRTQNGFIFWGLSKPTPQAANLLECVESSWKRYRERVDQLLAKGVTDENREAVAGMLRSHREAFLQLG